MSPNTSLVDEVDRRTGGNTQLSGRSLRSEVFKKNHLLYTPPDAAYLTIEVLMPMTALVWPAATPETPM